MAPSLLLVLASADEIGRPRHAAADLQAVLRAKPLVECAILYGSHAKGNYRLGSDTDLLALDGRIDDLLPPWKVDLQLRHLIDNLDLLATSSAWGIYYISPLSHNPIIGKINKRE